MLEFPGNYFNNEEREGFLVDTTMKTVWAAELEVLNEVAAICARHGLQWFAAYGTLLGAVRHQGFIPWDDDIDIWMKRDDYRKVLELLPVELPEGYVVRAPQKRPGYPEYQVYVNNSDHISIEPERLRRFHGCPFFVGIDIFPLDEVPARPEEVAIQRAVFSSALLLQELDYKAEYEKESYEKSCREGISIDSALAQIDGISNTLWTEYRIELDKKLIKYECKDELLKKLWNIAEEFPKTIGSSRWLAMYIGYLRYRIGFNKEWFDEMVYLPFEGFDIAVPGYYEGVLRVIYGSDYMIPVRQRGEHDYPCYKGQLENLKRHMAEQSSNLHTEY